MKNTFKSIKKIVALVLAMMMIFALAACSDSGDEKKTLTMATNAEFPPYEFWEGEKIVGIDAEIAALKAEELGMELVIEDVPFSSVLTGISTGKYDIAMAGITWREDRDESGDFSISYATGLQVVIVKEGSDITSVDDLFEGGYTIGVQEATTGDIYATSDIEDAGLGTVMRYNKGADAVAALVAGKVDCVIIDNEPAKSFVAANAGLKILDTEYALEDYCAYLPTGSELLDDVNEIIQKLIDNGKIQEIIDKYISAN